MASFPSLQFWDFGLLAKQGVGIEQLRALAEQISALCDVAYALYDDGRNLDGVELYEYDKDGLVPRR